MKLFGKPGKAGKEQKPEQVPGGRVLGAVGGNVQPGPAIVYGRQPLAWALAVRLHTATSLTSPMVRGRFRPGLDGAATSRGRDGGSPDLGSLQAFRGLVGQATSARLGAQGGPSSQPGYPSTGSSAIQALANMRRPDVQRFGGLR